MVVFLCLPEKWQVEVAGRSGRYAGKKRKTGEEEHIKSEVSKKMKKRGSKNMAQ